jgi:hypothetical protein
MSEIIETAIRISRPAGPRGKIDRYLPKIASDLKGVIHRVKRDMPKLGESIDSGCEDVLAAYSVLFGEDIHCRLGMWRALEKWNEDLFGTPLPFLVPVGGSEEKLRGFDPRRVQHFLWRAITVHHDEPDGFFFMNPCHEELAILAKEVSQFLKLRFSKKMPQDSPIRRILGKCYPEAPDLKEKLVCLARGSYLLCTRAPHDDPRDAHSINEYYSRVNELDDYICQSCSSWAGMGALDLLPGILGLEGQDKEDLASWSRRILSAYKVTGIQRFGDKVDNMEVLNLLNGKTYTVIVGTAMNVEVGYLLYGSLVPWRGNWFWSGAQRSLGMPKPGREEEIKEDLEKNHPNWVYRSCPDKEEKAWEIIRRHHNHFINYYGDDLKVFPDVETMARSEKERTEAYNQQRAWAKGTPGEEPKIGKDFFPDSMMEWSGKAAAFSDPAIGISYIPEFCLIESAMCDPLRDDDEAMDRLWHLMEDHTAPPSLVRRLVREYGADGLARLFKCKGHPGELVVEYFLRCFKGERYRKQTPHVSVL